MDIRVGATPINREGIVTVFGTVTGVSSATPSIIEIPNFLKAGKITRICCEDITNNNNPSTIIELWNVNPSGTTHAWNRVYRKEFKDLGDDFLHEGYFLSEDSATKSLWLKLAPTGGTSNTFEYFIMGVEGIRR